MVRKPAEEVAERTVEQIPRIVPRPGTPQQHYMDGACYLLLTMYSASSSLPTIFALIFVILQVIQKAFYLVISMFSDSFCHIYDLFIEAGMGNTGHPNYSCRSTFTGRWRPVNEHIIFRAAASQSLRQYPALVCGVTLHVSTQIDGGDRQNGLLPR